MAKKSPKQIVEQDFGGRDKLISELLPLLESADTADTQRRLRGAPNSKLLALHQAGTEVRKRFQSKSNLVAEIARKKFAPHKPDPAYAERLSGYSVRRLLDLHRRVSG